MCDYFWPRMENGHGDLADIVRAGGRIGLENTGLEPAAQLQLTSDPVVFPAINESPTHNFGHPFVDLRGPLLSQVDMSVEFFDGAETMVPPAEMAMEVSGSGRGGGGRFLAAQKVLSSEQERHCNIFSRVLQIPPGGSNPSQLSPRLIKPSSLVAGEMMKVSSGSTANPVGQYGDEVQISPPQTPGIKRRKNQAKKVVCIPAPAPASSRPSGEVIPSDLWAWRKYGQKPIKGSPHPRGYYRCSSSKGCSARKQVERSRTDPNILVITYTSEHNHPWPTQRNALAGSTRSHPCKNAVKSSNDSILKPPTDPKEKPEKATSSSAHLVKEDVAAEMEKAIEPAEENELRQSYDPMNISEEDQPDIDFFADLAELETDPVSLIFSKGFMETKPDGVKALDPFSMFEYWAGSS